MQCVYVRMKENYIQQNKITVANILTEVPSGVGRREREELCMLESFCRSPIRRNSVLEELRVRRLAAMQEEICCRAFCK